MVERTMTIQEFVERSCAVEGAGERVAKHM